MGRSSPAPGRSLPWGAILAAILFLLVTGAGYRVAAARLARAGGSVPIPRGTLARLPLEIESWRGEDVALSEAVVRATDTDDHVNRTYRQGGRAVALFVAYGVRLRDLTPHRPEVCYRGAGWTLLESRRGEVKSASGRVVPYQVQRFQRSGLDAEQIVVLNYYIVDGEHCADVSLLRHRGWRGANADSYSAQVQVTALETGMAGDAEAQVRRFAAASADPIDALLTESVRAAAEQRADAS